MTERAAWEYERVGDFVFRSRPSGSRSKSFEWEGEARRGEFTGENVIFEVMHEGASVHVNHGSTKEDVLRKLKAEVLS